MTAPVSSPPASSRRSFLRQSALITAGGLASTLAVERAAHAAGSEVIRLGLIGCGGRGLGAARQALLADRGVQLIAAHDAFEDRLRTGLRSIQEAAEVGSRARVKPDHQFSGFDGFEGVLASDVDAVLLATPPHFRPLHLRACLKAGKHVFAEKPVAVDAPGVRAVLESTEVARRKGLCLVSGLNGRYAPPLQETIRRIHDGAIGRIVGLHAARYGAGVWVRPRQTGETEMQYQMRNWYYFTWLSGDFNVEQFVHQLDRMAWVMQDHYPQRCYSTGGRQARTGPDHGHIYDHFSSVFEYPEGIRVFSTTRHQEGCSSESQAVVFGTEGTADLSQYAITGPRAWRAPRGPVDSHQLEQDAFIRALRSGETINNGVYMAKSTLMAIMSRISAYTGQSLSWEQVLNSEQSLAPSAYAWDGNPPPAEVAVPGVTPFG